MGMRAALLLRDATALRDVLGRFDGLGAHGAALHANRISLGAGLAALEGHRTAALRGYREGVDRLRALGLRWVVAQTGLEMITVLPSEPAAVELALEARATMMELGATPVLGHLDAALAATGHRQEAGA